MKQITKNEDILSRKNILNKDRAWDIPGGVSLNISELIRGNYLAEGTPISAPVNGIRYICKQGILLGGSTTKNLRVEKGSNQFGVGNVVTLGANKKAFTVASITAESDYDVLNLATAIDAVATGDFIYEAKESATGTTSELKRSPDAILKFAQEVPHGEMVMFASDAYSRADVVETAIGAEYLEALKFINVIKY